MPFKRASHTTMKSIKERMAIFVMAHGDCYKKQKIDFSNKSIGKPQASS